MIENIPFTVSARTARLIGQENFANAEGAIIELVKNGYDADADGCLIIFDNENPDTSKHSLYIVDNGFGMTDYVLKHAWMIIGTDNKEKNSSTPKGRVKTGAKGIGRFALDRLGRYASIETKPENSNDAYIWKVDWMDFQVPDIPISEVQASLEKIPEYNIKDSLKEKFKHSTKLLKTIEGIDLTHGTIIQISGLKDLWPYEDIKKLYDNLEVLVPPKEQDDFKINLKSMISIDDFGEISGLYYDDYDYKVSARYKSKNNKNIHITIQRNELVLSKLETDYVGAFDNELLKKYPYTLEDFKKETFSFNLPINNLIKGLLFNEENNLIDQIGDFGFTFYFIKNMISDDVDGDTRKYPYRYFNSANRKAWLRKFGGIKIFRDGFRVRPYGENGDDWLKLGDRQARSPGGAGQKIGGYKVRPGQISGRVNISRLTNSYFVDKSGREGIQENDTFELFKNILIEIIALFERDRNVIMFALSEFQRERKEEAAKAEEARKAIDEVLQKEKDKDKQEEIDSHNNIEKEDEGDKEKESPSEREILIAKHAKSQEEVIIEKENEIQLLRSLASIGLIVSSVAHELKNIQSKLLPRTDNLCRALDHTIDKIKLNNIQDFFNPYILLGHMKEQDKQIDHWLSYSLSALKKDRRRRIAINISDYFLTFKESWQHSLDYRKVELSLFTTGCDSVSLRAFWVDLDTIFNNLLVNSFDAFKSWNNTRPRIVNIECSVNENKLDIIYSDTGPGIFKDFKNPDDIFIAQETSKRDNKGNEIGTGMGMYLLKTVVDEYDGSTKLLEHDGFKIKITLPLRKK